MCKQKAGELIEHHVVEGPDENGKTPSIDLYKDCHEKHERYRNYLRTYVESILIE